MNPVMNIYGVYIPFLGILILSSYIINIFVQWVINKLQLEKYIWHRSVFSAAIYFIILGTLSIINARIG